MQVTASAPVVDTESSTGFRVLQWDDPSGSVWLAGRSVAARPSADCRVSTARLWFERLADSGCVDKRRLLGQRRCVHTCSGRTDAYGRLSERSSFRNVNDPHSGTGTILFPECERSSFRNGHSRERTTPTNTPVTLMDTHRFSSAFESAHQRGVESPGDREGRHRISYALVVRDPHESGGAVRSGAFSRV